MSTSPANPRTPRIPDFVLTSDELRAVTAFNLACAEQVIDLFEEVQPNDTRPKEALNAAAAFVGGGPRSMAQRVSALAAHRAAKEVGPPAVHAAMAAGDAAASAYLHPLADAAQVGHILRGPAYCVLALQHRPVEPLTRSDAVAAVLQYASPQVIHVLLRYPRVRTRRQEVTSVMGDLDARLRGLVPVTEEAESYGRWPHARSVIAAGRRHSVGVRADGSVLTAGVPHAPECRVGAWRDIVAVAAGNVHTASNTGRSHTVGLRADGTVVAVGWNGDGQCDVADWRGVVGIAAGWRRTLAVLADGTVRAAGRPREGACDVNTWSEIVAAAAGDWHSVALRADGTATAAGNNRRGQCEVSGWRSLHSIVAGYLHTAAVTEDGRVLAAGDAASGVGEVSGWRDVVGVSAGSRHTVGVDTRGRVFAAGDNSRGQCDVASWRDVIAVAAGSAHTLGLCADGVVLAAGNNDNGQCDITRWQIRLR